MNSIVWLLNQKSSHFIFSTCDRNRELIYFFLSSKRDTVISFTSPHCAEERQYSSQTVILFTLPHHTKKRQQFVSLLVHHAKEIKLSCILSPLIQRRLIDWLLGLNAQAAVFQLYSGVEHEMDDKINMKWWWNKKKGRDTRIIGSTNFDCH